MEVNNHDEGNKHKFKNSNVQNSVCWSAPYVPTTTAISVLLAAATLAAIGDDVRTVEVGTGGSLRHVKGMGHWVGPGCENHVHVHHDD